MDVSNSGRYAFAFYRESHYSVPHSLTLTILLEVAAVYLNTGGQVWLLKSYEEGIRRV